MDTAGVNPPNNPAARLKASENPEARIFAGMISVSSATIDPLYPPKMTENHTATTTSLPKEGAVVSQSNTG